MLQITFQTTKNINSLLVRKHYQLKSYENWNWGSMLMRTALVRCSEFKESKFRNDVRCIWKLCFSSSLNSILSPAGTDNSTKIRRKAKYNGKTETDVCVCLMFSSHSSISSFKKHYLKNVCLFTHNYLVGLKRAIVCLSFVFLLSEVLFVFACNQNNLYSCLSE